MAKRTAARELPTASHALDDRPRPSKRRARVQHDSNNPTDRLTAQLDAWINQRVDQPPVPLAGAAKRVPDADLPMFRESRLASAYPPVFPTADSRRPRSLGLGDDRRLQTRKVVTKVEVERSSLPMLHGPPPKDKQVLDRLLSECRPKAAIAAESEPSDRASNQPASARVLSGLVIPDEVFFECHSFLPLARVDLNDWTEFCGDDSDVNEQIAAKLSRSCVDVDLSGLPALTSAKELANLLASCSHLERLNLSRFANLPKAAFHGLGRKCSALQHLSVADSDAVTDDMLNAIVTALPRLTSLDLTGCAGVTDAGVALVAKKLPRLECIRLDDCAFVSDASLLQLVVARGSRLRTLSVRRCRKVTDAAVKELLASLPRVLEELNLSECIDVTDDSLEFLVSVPSFYGSKRVTSYTAMRRLDVSGCGALTTLSFSWISAACPLLVSLNVSRCAGMCDKGIRVLSTLDKLEHLDLSDCTRLSDIGVTEFFAAKWTNGSRRPVQSLVLAGCSGVGEKTLDALIDSCCESLTSLDVRCIAPVPFQVLVKLVRRCRALTRLLLSNQPGVTRTVLANLASCNRSLQTLELSDCAAVDDLALYPLLVMDSMTELSLSGCSHVTSRGLRSLPRNVIRLTLRGLPIDDDSCQAMAGHVRRLQVLDASDCMQPSPSGLKTLFAKCQQLRQLNVFGNSAVQPQHLASLLLVDDNRREMYRLEVIADEAENFYGIASADPEASIRAQRRQELADRLIRYNHAASTIQTRFRTRRRLRMRQNAENSHDWTRFCAAIDIQRMVRGFQCRQRYWLLRVELSSAVVVLQRQWRRRREQRRTRKATSYWTNRVVLKTFLQWKHWLEQLRVDAERARAEAQAAKALRFWGHRTLPRVLAAWREVARRKRQQGRKALGFWKFRSLPRAFAAWARLTATERHHRLRLTHVLLNVVELETLNSTRQQSRVDKANAFVTRLIWRRWLEFAAAQQRFVLQARRSIVCVNLLRWAFRQWREHTQRERGLRAKNAKLLARVLHRDKSRVWAAWREFVLAQRGRKRAMALFAATTRTKCWLHWRAFLRERLALRSLSACVAQRLQALRALNAVRDWLEFARHQRAKRMAQRRALLLWTNATLLRCFTAWASYTARVAAFRLRLQALLEHANVAFTFTTWVWFTRGCRRRHAMATRLQAFWRGFQARRRVEDWFYMRLWAVVLLQTAWRGRLGRAMLRAATRKARLREYLRAERERDAMGDEEQQTREFDRAVAMVVAIQRQWRGVAARNLFVEVRRARFLRRKAEEAERQELVRVEARRRQLERVQREKLRQAAAIEIQRHARGWLARRWFATQRALLDKIRAAMRVQAVYRGRISRRRTAALRRSYLTRMELLARRAVEGKALRALGATTRPTQRGLRSFLAYFGLDPASFLTDVRDVFREVREDFAALTAFLDVVRAKVHANQAAEDALTSSTPSQDGSQPSGGPNSVLHPSRGLFSVLQRAKAAKKHLDDVERVMEAEQRAMDREQRAIRAGDAVRIVLRGHPRCGETAFVLGVQDAIAQVKLDVDGALEFLPAVLPSSRLEPEREVMHRVPQLAFSGLVGAQLSCSKISGAWRAQLEAYAASIALEARRLRAARTIQCAARVYLARVRYQQELEAQGVNAARRQEALLRVLRTCRCANTRVAALLVQLRLVRPLNVPPGLPDEPLVVQKIVDRCRRWAARRQELRAALLQLSPVTAYAGDLEREQALPVPLVRALDKLLFYPLQCVQRATSVPLARSLERHGLAELAAVVGGAEFAKTFAQRHTRARPHRFAQLAGCRWCASEGRALVHGVFERRSVVEEQQRAALWRGGGKRTRTRLVPHGWGVAHLLSGRSSSGSAGVDWFERSSVEAQFKSLQLVRALKQQERAERLEAQILTRQGSWNALRAAEGARGFAKRHAELSALEEKTKAFFARFEKERALRRREQRAIVDEERRANALVARERRELERQGSRLSELQQQPPEPVAEVALLASRKSALEFLAEGCALEVEFDDEAWYECRVVALDVFESQTAEVEYAADGKRERIRLVERQEGEPSAGEEEKKLLPRRTVAELTAAAAARKAMREVPFRRWRAGKAVDVVWEPPHDNGSRITQYVLEWRVGGDEEDGGNSADKQPTEDGGEVAAEPRAVTSGSSVIEAPPDEDDDFSDSEGDSGSEIDTVDGQHSGDQSNDEADKPAVVEADSTVAKSKAETDEKRPRRQRWSLPPPTKTTLWPIPPEHEQSLRVRVAAVNDRGAGIASVYLPLDKDELVEVSYATAVPLTRPSPDTSKLEEREWRAMTREDKRAEVFRRRLTCSVCALSLPSEPAVHDHMCRAHAVPLVCPFKSCAQVCASERALRYHMWRCSVSQPTAEERVNDIFMEIFNISRQYCLRKPRRHALPSRSTLRRQGDHTNASGGADLDEEEFLETKYGDALAAWLATGKARHEQLLAQGDEMRRRERENQYAPPSAQFGVDFVNPELNVARRSAVINAIGMLREDLEAFRRETTTQLDQWGADAKELQDYIALKAKRIKASDEEWQRQSLKREKKKAEKSLAQVKEQIADLVASSTRKINEMEAELARLTRIEQAFVPFIHQVIRLNRMGVLVGETHRQSNTVLDKHAVILAHFQEDLRKLMVRMNTEVDTLEAWDAMLAARRKQLEALRDELERLRREHTAEMQRYRQQRDAGDELFELGKLRYQQVSIVHQREIAERELLGRAKQTRVQAAASAQSAAKAAQQVAELEQAGELRTTIDSLHIANHDLHLHGKFLRGKVANAAYLADDVPKDSNPDENGKAVDEATEAGQATTESPSPGEIHTDDDGQSSHPSMLPDVPEPKPRKRDNAPHTYARIECEFQDGLIAGRVRVEFTDGSVYEGPWVEDATSYEKPANLEPMKTRVADKHWGKFTTFDGAVWTGEEVDNFFSPFTATGEHFEVTAAPPARHVYRGAVRAGKFHGFGVLQISWTMTRGEYVGEWREGQRHGYGIERLESGEIYEGYWSFDRYHGDGELVYDDGSRYCGAFERGRWHGEGERTLPSGDKICGNFHDGFLDGPGVVEFADKRHYHGEFVRTRRHGLGVLAFPNGERYEGPFEHDEPHGDGLFYSRQSGSGELLVRRGRWVRGERVAWLSQPSSQVATATFVAYFATQRTVEGEPELDLRLEQFRSPYAVLVARMLPLLPEGVDAADPFVRAVVAQLAKAQSVVLGSGVLDQTIAEHAEVATKLAAAEGDSLESLRNEVETAERHWRECQHEVDELAANLDEKVAQEEAMQVKVELFWRGDTSHLELAYRHAVERLHAVDPEDWYRLRAAKLDDALWSVLRAFAVLLCFTSNRYLAGQPPYEPTREDVLALLSSSDENVLLGDREGLIHRYAVKALYVLPRFDAYSFAAGARRELLLALTPVIHHPRLRPGNVRLHQASPALPVVCAWVRAAFAFARKASEVAPVVGRAMQQLVVVDYARQKLSEARVEFERATVSATAARTALTAHREMIDGLRARETELRHVLDDIDALDRAEAAPIAKQGIRRPVEARPDSAAPGGGGNRRQAFGNGEADDRENDRVDKEDVLAALLGDDERAQALATLKLEVRKVLDKQPGGAPVPLADFPAQFETWMLKPLDPQAFGVKKLRTLLLMLSDVCEFVEPAKEGDVEAVRLREADDDGIDEDEEDEDERAKTLSHGPMPPRRAFACRTCPGVSFAAAAELRLHATTKWHFWNAERRRAGRKPWRWTVGATCWAEAYDASSGQVCFVNRLSGMVVSAADGPPLEMQADDVMLELLDDAPAALAATVETSEETIAVVSTEWEEVADADGNVFFCNRETGETSWSRPGEMVRGVEGGADISS